MAAASPPVRILGTNASTGQQEVVAGAFSYRLASSLMLTRTTPNIASSRTILD